MVDVTVSAISDIKFIVEVVESDGVFLSGSPGADPGGDVGWCPGDVAIAGVVPGDLGAVDENAVTYSIERTIVNG